MKRLAMVMGLVGLLVWGSIAIAPQSWAGPLCYATQGHDLCLLSIKRSAKYHWQYRAQVSVDGQPRPLATYDCQRRRRQDPDGQFTSFEQDWVGDFLCQLVNR